MADERTVIVTGGGSGIGRVVCLDLAARAARVLVVDRDEAAAEETAAAAGAGASAFAADVSDPDQVAAYVRACEERYGGVDGFFNNAGIEGAIAPIPDYPLADFDRVLAVNLRGVFLGLQHVIPALRRRGGGSIVNTASQAGLRGVSGLSAYAASKHAVVGLSKSAALETARDGIRVNCVCPGPTDTRMMQAIGDAVRARGADPGVFVEKIPVGRMGEPEEVASLVVWLLLEAPVFLTGAVLPVDGAMTVP